LLKSVDGHRKRGYERIVGIRSKPNIAIALVLDIIRDVVPTNQGERMGVDNGQGTGR
jgi:hypothetical protein